MLKLTNVTQILRGEERRTETQTIQYNSQFLNKLNIQLSLLQTTNQSTFQYQRREDHF